MKFLQSVRCKTKEEKMISVDSIMNMEMMKRNLRERRQFLNFGFAFHRGARHNTFISLCSWLEGEDF